MVIQTKPCILALRPVDKTHKSKAFESEGREAVISSMQAVQESNVQ